MVHRFHRFMILIGLALMSVNATAQTYDAASDFSWTNNPNGVWSYGWEPSRGATFSLDTTTFTIGVIDLWGSNNSNPTSVGHNPLNLSVTQQSYTVPAGGLGFHPGKDGVNSVVRWTAPRPGTVTVLGYFMGDDFDGPATVN